MHDRSWSGSKSHSSHHHDACAPSSSHAAAAFADPAASPPLPASTIQYSFPAIVSCFCFLMIASPTSSSIFVYGTLMSPQVLRVLLGRIPSSLSPALLSGYQRHSVRGQVFPGMIPSNNVVNDHKTQGILLQGLSEKEVRVLDYFEGDEYSRRDVTVSCQGQSYNAQTYVWSNPLSELNLDQEWDYAHFCENHLECYLETTVRLCRLEMNDLGMY